jgi:hypothetical protein
MGTSVVSSGDATPVFDAAEHILDVVALSVEGFVVWQFDFSASY